MTGPRLPARVLLPDQPMMPAWHLRTVLGASKQVLSLWRKRLGFPPTHHDGGQWYTSTAAVAEWLRGRNVEVKVVELTL